MSNDCEAERPSVGLPEALRTILHAKEEICNQLNALPEQHDVDYPAEIARLSDAFAAAGELPPEFSEILEKQFAAALKNAQDGAEKYAEACRNAEKLAEDVKQLLAADAFATLREIEALEKRIAAVGKPELAAELAPLKARLEAEAAAEKEKCDKITALTDELTALTDGDDINALHDRKPQIDDEFAAIENPPRAAANRFQEARRKASVKLAQHYETLDLARWESYTLKLDLCTKLETMLAAPEAELGGASKALNELREKWKQLGSVPREKNEEINARYLDLTRKVQHRVDEYFAGRRQMQKLAAAEKEKLCAEAEALADSTDWKVSAEKFREMQTAWKALPRAGAADNELFQRFHAACDRFFTARKAVLDARNQQFKAAEERKLALIAEAEAMSDPRRARQMREEYRNAGSAGRKEQELYARFNAALDKFFSGRREEGANREKKARELIAEAAEAAASPLEKRERVKAIRQELRDLGCRNTRDEEQKALRAFDAALAAVLEEKERQRLASSDATALTLAQCYADFKTGSAPAAPDPAAYANFPKLQQAAELLVSALGGDEKAAQKLEKQIAAARTEREEICAELEKLAGTGKKSAEKSLAEELESAILGNFAKAEHKERLTDPRQLCSRYASAGLLPPDELTASLERFNALCKVIFPEKA